MLERGTLFYSSIELCIDDVLPIREVAFLPGYILVTTDKKPGEVDAH